MKKAIIENTKEVFMNNQLHRKVNILTFTRIIKVWGGYILTALTCKTREERFSRIVKKQI